MNRPAAFSAVVLLLGSTVAHGQDVTSQTVPQTELAAIELVGKEVRDVEGTSVGEVAELVVDGDQRVEAVVVELGGFLGIGAKPVLLQASELRVDEEDVVHVGLSTPQLDALPSAE